MAEKKLNRGALNSGPSQDPSGILSARSALPTEIGPN